MVRWLAAAVLVTGCKKEVVDTGPTGSCDDIETATLSSVSATEYPEGLSEQLVAWRALPGVYEADYCGRGTITVKLDQMPPVEELQMVTAGIDERIPCGCTTDPLITDDDNALGAYTWGYNASVFLFDETNEFDPEILEHPINGVVVPVNWALLPPGSPTSMRGCAKVALDDDSGTYTDATVVIRVSSSGGLEGSVVFYGDTDLTCDLTAFEYIIGV